VSEEELKHEEAFTERPTEPAGPDGEGDGGRL